MFGEYAIYSNGKVAALVCDDRLFVKPTLAGSNCGAIDSRAQAEGKWKPFDSGGWQPRLY